MNKVIVIIGAGNGISKAVAEKFGTEGFSVVLISRREEKLEELQHALKNKNIDAHFFVADAGDSDSIKDAFNQIWEIWENIDVLHYNVAKRKKVNIVDESVDGLTRDFKINVASVMTAVTLVLPDMEKKGKGTILLTIFFGFKAICKELGSLSIGKAAIRNLANSLHIALKPKNIFVGTVTVCGAVQNDSSERSTQHVAQKFWELYTNRNEFEIQY